MPSILVGSWNIATSKNGYPFYPMHTSIDTLNTCNPAHFVREDNMAPIIERGHVFIIRKGMLICTKGSENGQKPLFNYEPGHRRINQELYKQWLTLYRNWQQPQPVTLSAKPINRDTRVRHTYAVTALNRHFENRDIYFLHEIYRQPWFLRDSAFLYSQEGTYWQAIFPEDSMNQEVMNPTEADLFRGRAQPFYKQVQRHNVPPEALVVPEKVIDFHTRNTRPAQPRSAA